MSAFRSASRVPTLVAILAMTLGCSAAPGTVVPVEAFERWGTLDRANAEFEIDVAPRFRYRVPNRDSSLRWHAPYVD